MNRPMLIALGVILAVASSFYGLVAFPQKQLGSIEPVVITSPDGSEISVPHKLDEWREAPGRMVYQSMGCVYCHSQQVRPEGFGSDLERGWGSRRSVPRDYVYAPNPLLGTMRTGPDLADIGSRQPNAGWHYLHLYNPRLTSPGSVMPPMSFLFDVRIGRSQTQDVDAVKLPYQIGGQDAYIVPDRRAQELVAYLLSLKQRGTFEEVR